MSDQISNTPPPQQQPALQSGVTLTDVLKAIRENFILVSAAAVLLGVTLSTTFLAAYLSVFDWHLLWFVQYTDIITFGLLAVGIITVSMIFIQATAQTALDLFAMKGRTRWVHAIPLLCIVSVIIGFEIWAANKSGEGYFHILMGVSSLGLGIMFIKHLMGYVTTAVVPNISQAFFLIMSLGVTTISIGQWLGYSVQESAKGQEVTFKEKTMSDMKVVVVMSRHTILLKDGMLYVVPTADIASFKGGDQFTRPKAAPEK
jgi:hypothetical protein